MIGSISLIDSTTAVSTGVWISRVTVGYQKKAENYFNGNILNEIKLSLLFAHNKIDYMFPFRIALVVIFHIYYRFILTSNICIGTTKCSIPI